MYLSWTSEALNIYLTSYLFEVPECWFGPGYQTCNLLLCSLALSHLSYPFCGLNDRDLRCFQIQSLLCLILFLAELGEYDPKEHTMGYVSEFRFIPNQV